jgi:hypothetical protein
LEKVGSSLGTEGEGGRGRFKLTCWSSDDIRDISDNGISSSESSEHSIRENLGSEGFKGAEVLIEVEAAEELMAATGATRSLFKDPFSGKRAVVSASP